MTNSWQIENFLSTTDGRLTIDGVDAVELAREHGTPLFVFSESRIRHNIERLRKAANVIDCPLKLCYAAKANSVMGILRAVKSAGCDLEVNSGGELLKALKAGFLGSQIIFNGTSKEVWELELAIESGIYAIQVDSVYELSLISETAKRLGKVANVSLRLVPEIETGTHSGLQTALLTSKFGMMPDEAVAAFHQYKNNSELNLCGIHLHIGSQNPEPSVYKEAFVALFDQLLTIHLQTGIKLKHINLGGGFPVNYSRGKAVLAEETQKNIDEMIERGYTESKRLDGSIDRSPIPESIIEHEAREKMFRADFEPQDAIAAAWKEVKAQYSSPVAAELLKDLTILLEPGRSVIADTGVCLTTVRNAKKRPIVEINRQLTEDAKAELERPKAGDADLVFVNTHRSFHDKTIDADHWLLTDAGFNILLSMETYKWYYHLISAERADAEADFPYKLAGPLCDGGDVYFDIEGEGRLPEYRLLPKDVAVGETLALLNCGAYSLAQASQYNGRFLPPVVLIKTDDTHELIRRRDKFDDLIASDL